jgi:hypothetical protein
MTHNGNRKSQVPPEAAAKEKRQPDRQGGDRDARGRFSRGNKAGPGNPYARRVALLRRAMLSIVKPNDMRAIIVKMILLAGEGDVAAARLVLQYTLGKPAETVDPDRVDLDEVEQAKERLAFKPALAEALGGMPPHMACNMGRTLLAGFEAELPTVFGKMLKEAEGTPDTAQAEEQPAAEASSPTAAPERRERDNREMGQECTSQPPRVLSMREQLERLLAVLFQLKPEGLTDAVENGEAPHARTRAESARERKMSEGNEKSTVNKRLYRCDPDEDDELLRELDLLDNDSDG